MAPFHTIILIYYFLSSKYEELRALVQEGSQKNLSKTIIEQGIFTDKIGLGKFWFTDSSILGEAMGLYFLVDICSLYLLKRL